MSPRALPPLPAFVPPAGAAKQPVLSSLALPGVPAVSARRLPSPSDSARPVDVAASPGSADPADPALRKKAEEAAIKFEGFFIAQMLRGMQRTVREVAAEDSSYKSQINDDMLDMAHVQVADKMAQLRSFGIADAILRQILPPAGAPVPASGLAPMPPRKAS